MNWIDYHSGGLVSSYCVEMKIQIAFGSPRAGAVVGTRMTRARGSWITRVPALIDRVCLMIDEIPWYDWDDAAL